MTRYGSFSIDLPAGFTEVPGGDGRWRDGRLLLRLGEQRRAAGALTADSDAALEAALAGYFDLTERQLSSPTLTVRWYEVSSSRRDGWTIRRGRLGALGAPQRLWIRALAAIDPVSNELVLGSALLVDDGSWPEGRAWSVLETMQPSVDSTGLPPQSVERDLSRLFPFLAPSNLECAATWPLVGHGLHAALGRATGGLPEIVDASKVGPRDALEDLRRLARANLQSAIVGGELAFDMMDLGGPVLSIGRHWASSGALFEPTVRDVAVARLGTRQLLALVVAPQRVFVFDARDTQKANDLLLTASIVEGTPPMCRGALAWTEDGPVAVGL